MRRVGPIPVIAAIAVAAACGGSSAKPVGPRAADCAPGDGSAVTQVVRDMYARLAVDDATTIDLLFTPDFYGFDGGERYTARELFAMIKQAHDAGRSFVWEVTAPDPHLACDVAWLTWENRGAIIEGDIKKAITWRESAVLRRIDGAWRLAFFHSTRVPPPKNPS